MLDELGGRPDLALVFVSGHLDAERAVAGLWTRLPEGTPLVGCTSDLEVDTRGAVSNSVAILGLSLPGVAARTFQVPAAAGRTEVGEAAGRAIAGERPSLVIAFPDVLGGNATGFLDGLAGQIGADVPVVGGAPGDGARFKETRTILGRTVQVGGASGVALAGPLRIACAARSGYVPIGGARRVTRREGTNRVLELDGRRALDVYREYLGERAGEIPGATIEFPIAVIDAESPEQGLTGAIKLVRAVFAVDEAAGALILGGDIPAGAIVRVAQAVRADILSGARAAFDAALAELPDPDVALVFSCASRNINLGARYREECRSAFAGLPAELAKFGFYTFGELSPVAGVNTHHESTFTVVLLRGGPG